MPSSPVALFLYNRPEPTARVFAAVREARPEKLLLIADGPRSERGGDAEAVAATREVVAAVDWPCRVTRNFAPANQGVGTRISTGISWVFTQVDEAILLEDDCLPDPSFFGFCTELLARYRDDQSVMMVSGTNELLRWKDDVQDYHFSCYGSIWGWATWKRAWRHNDFELSSADDPAVVQRVADQLQHPDELASRTRTVRRVRSGEVDTWDYQWTWSRLARGGLAAVSAVNLVSNIGFGKIGTHTVRLDLARANLHRYSARTPLRGPPSQSADRDFDRRLYLSRERRPDAPTMLAFAGELIASGRAVTALALLDRALLKWPADPALHFGKAVALSRLDRRDRAIAALRATLRLDPGHDEARSRLDLLLANTVAGATADD
jgi:hypothetical protein